MTPKRTKTKPGKQGRGQDMSLYGKKSGMNRTQEKRNAASAANRTPENKPSKLIAEMEKGWRNVAERAIRKGTMEPLKNVLNPDIPYKNSTIPVSYEDFVTLYFAAVWVALHDGGGLKEMDVLYRAEGYREELWMAEEAAVAVGYTDEKEGD